MTKECAVSRDVVETRMRSKKQPELCELWQRYAFLRRIKSTDTDTLLALLGQPFGNPQAGRLMRLLVKECKSPAPLSVANDLLMWTMIPYIKAHCKNVGAWFRGDAQQEGLTAVFEVARSIKYRGISDADFAEVFRKRVLLKIGRLRRREAKQNELLIKFGKHLSDLNLEVMNGDCERPKLTAPIVFYRDECAASEQMLRGWCGEAISRAGLDAFVANVIYGETTQAYARRISSSEEHQSAWERTRKQVTRLTKRLRDEFAYARGEYVAVESLWVSGSANTDVPLARLYDQVLASATEATDEE